MKIDFYKRIECDKNAWQQLRYAVRNVNCQSNPKGSRGTGDGAQFVQVARGEI